MYIYTYNKGTNRGVRLLLVVGSDRIILLTVSVPALLLDHLLCGIYISFVFTLCERIVEKISYELHVNESVDDKSFSWAILVH